MAVVARLAVVYVVLYFAEVLVIHSSLAMVVAIEAGENLTVQRNLVAG